MDRNLPANHRFALNEDSANAGKLHIFVKLTDSCMKAIETYITQNKKQNSSNKANIKFNIQGGEISIPIANGERKAYSFNISPENKTPEVFQCIKQINRNHLESCAVIEQRLNIHAQEDVYSMTKTKVTEFQKHEEQTKKQTKEIGESSKKILEKQKKHNSSSQRSTTTSTSTNQRQARPAISSDQHLSPTSTNNPLLSSERPLRERLVHLLAARTYKKPDLILRLKHDGGIRDDEKEQLDTVLSLITTQPKNGEYVLSKSILSSGEVNYDWSFYPKGEASIVRKKIKELQNNANRPKITKPANEAPSGSTSSSRLSLPNISLTSNASIGTSASVTKPKASTPLVTQPARSTTSDERSHTENEETINPPVNPLSDERMQQLSQMLEKMSNAISLSEKANDQFLSEDEMIDDDELDRAEKEYNDLVPEYNNLIDYLKTVSDKFAVFQQEFHEDKNSEKASKIVDEFFKYENNDGFLNKRQRLFDLHFKLIRLQKILQKNSPSNNFDISDDED